MGAPGTTPGRWSVEADKRSERTGDMYDAENGYRDYLAGWNIVAPDSGKDVVGIEGICPDDEAEANAHQMAASGALYDALEKARDQFLFYEQSHLAKYPPWELEMLRKGIVDVSMGRDAYDKAQTNAEYAAMCDAALKLARGESS